MSTLTNMRSKPYFHTEFNKGPDNNLYTRGAMIAVKTAA